MRDDPTVVDLVHRARDGDKDAWNDIVERYAPLLWSICHRYGLARLDADDVGQSVWLQLLEHLPSLREPAALPGWLATTTRRECLRVIRAGRRQELMEPVAALEKVRTTGESAVVEDEVFAAVRNAMLQDALAQLPSRCRGLLSMLMQDPPIPYAEISATVGIPVGSIGPTRARCLEKLRRSPAGQALIDAERATPEGGADDDR